MTDLTTETYEDALHSLSYTQKRKEATAYFQRVGDCSLLLALLGWGRVCDEVSWHPWGPKALSKETRDTQTQFGQSPLTQKV
jgi:hypothetical protein